MRWERRRIMECHNCCWAAQIKKWEHEGVRFEDTPCSKCTLEENSNYTRPFDAEAADALAARSGNAVSGAADDDGGVGEMPVSVLADAVRLLLSLPKDALEVVRLRYGGMPYAKIAEILGKSVDAVEKRHERVLAKNPVLGALFPRKVRKQKIRQRSKKGKSGKRGSGLSALGGAAKVIEQGGGL